MKNIGCIVIGQENLKYTETVYPHTKLSIAFGKVYSLADLEGNVFYVGSTTGDMYSRLSQHLSQARSKFTKDKTEKSKRIKSLNFKVVAKIIQLQWLIPYSPIYNVKSLARLEKKWIIKFFSLGYELCNKDGQPRKNLVETSVYVGKVFGEK